ncbi:lysophospholipid acyltransferase family protein [Mesoterricola silvestris]|nr:lysophospholipid acyltransferase family protein [Mesoterricola silvestris]
MAPTSPDSRPSFRHRAEAGLYHLVEGIVSRLPWETTLTLGRGLGRLAHALDRRHRAVVRENLRAADMGLDEAQVRAISLDCFEHFGTLALTAIHLLRMDEEELGRRVKVLGIENYDAAKAGGKGFIVLTGHYGNWEATALALSALGRTLSVIGRELDNPLLEPRLRELRGRFGNEVIPKAGAFRGALKALRMGKAVGFLLDQDALTAGVWVKFLGRWASTFPSAGLLAVKYGLPVVQLRSWPNADGTITVSVEPPFQVPVTGDLDRDVWTATQIMTRKIEDEIRREPRWWFWMHRRFKTRPGEGNPLPAPLPPDEWLLNSR